MHWTEPATAEDSHAELEKTLWDAANSLWANAALKPSEFSPIVLGLIFLRYAETRFAAVAEEIHPKPGSRRKIGPTDYHAKGVLYLPEEARFPHLLQLPEDSALGKAVNDAMRAVEKENPDLADVLPKTFQILENRTLAELLKVMASIPMDQEGDTFGLIYEYFLGKFAMSEGQKGGEFYTPTSIVRLIVDILEPYHGRIYDPACGSGGMFVQSARFVAEHHQNPTAEISVHGQERVTETSRLARLNLAVHGLSGDIRQGNTYYEDLHDSVGRFDFVLANPPFNVSKIDKERLADDPRYPLGLPRTDNGNYLWIQHFHSALSPQGRAGFVMANSAADARASEQDIREKLIRSGHVDVMVSISPNFFYTVTLPCTLWFLDKGKAGSPREDTVLFLDARHVFRQLDRSHRDFTSAQHEFLANVVRLYRGQDLEFHHGSEEKIRELFGDPSDNSPLTLQNSQFKDIPGLCKAATRAEIEAQGWSLNPGRYVGVAKGEELSDEDFKERFTALNEELEVLNGEAQELEQRIAENVVEILETA
ncbi:class I SAM-dependent DNA methyltransferase [Roseibacillus persicicus]|uniref:class I SAM-dependent DNA methyltransferase n=1 Tax=Roseibacillus persicicus TaxID=454148 RepID=UPI00280D63DD|nr:class I SAM-dependent DNA methyltransferase [Roseibacillus persicicus]MDQ8192005.1 class I SAM-dependent DNA methyltransferase [Roseibacillus persicicus]